MGRVRKAIAAAGVAGAGLVLTTSPAFAQYVSENPPPPAGPSDTNVLGNTVSNPPAAVLGSTQQAPTGSLPLTGTDIAALVVIGAGGVVVGTALVRRSRMQPV